MTGLAELLPACAVTVATSSDDTPAPLMPAEEQLVCRAVDSRRRELALGRQCARAALARLGAVAGPILAGGRGEPLWPHGYVGSITHCRGLVAAAAARAVDLVGLGIDAEPAEELNPALLDKICTPEERSWVAGAGGSLPRGKLIFSAKEAVYKCIYPTAGVLLEFRDVTLSVGEDGHFCARSRRCDLRALHGRWATTRTHVLTAAILER